MRFTTTIWSVWGNCSVIQWFYFTQFGNFFILYQYSLEHTDEGNTGGRNVWVINNACESIVYQCTLCWFAVKVWKRICSLALGVSWNYALGRPQVSFERIPYHIYVSYCILSANNALLNLCSMSRITQLAILISIFFEGVGWGCGGCTGWVRTWRSTAPTLVCTLYIELIV